MEDLEFGATIRGYSAGQKVFNRYTLERILGRGGMGVVWLARDIELDRPVALKFLPEAVALDRDSLDELRRETKRNLELTHPHIVRIYDFIHDERTAAISMEYVDGASLSALKTEQPDKIFPVEKLRDWLKQLGAALAYAHEDAQVVHRDLKPANLMIDTRGRLKVTDFGIARSISDSVTRVSLQAGSSGTPVYMSPQQMMGEKPAATDDVYALGATLYELLTGKPPFHTGNILLQVQSKVPPPVAERRKELGVAGDPVPPEWEQVIAACLAKEAKDRPQSMAAVLRMFEAGRAASAVKTEPPAGAPAETVQPSAPARGIRRTIWVGVGLAVVVALSGLAYFHNQARLREQAEQMEAARVAREGRYQDWVTKVNNIESDRDASDAVLTALEQEMAQYPEHQVEADKLMKSARSVVLQARKAQADLLARIDAFAAGAAPELRRQTDQAVAAFLAKAPDSHRAEVQDRWKNRQAVWEAARKNDFVSRQLKVPVGAGAPLILYAIPAGETTRPGGKLTITRPFWVGAKAISQAQWEALMPAKNVTEQTVKDRPARLMVWGAAVEFCRRLTASERDAGRLPAGYRYALPTEGELALAMAHVGQLGLGEAIEVTMPPGSADWRHYHEWMNDWFDADPPKGDLTDPLGPDYGKTGSFGQPQKLVMVGGVTRDYYGAGAFQTHLFRVVLTSRTEPPDVRTVPMAAGGTLTLRRVPGGSVEFNRHLDWGDIPATKPIIQVTRPYWLAERVISQAEWHAEMGSNPTPAARQRDDWPVDSLSWPEVQEFCRRLTERERKAGRIAGHQSYTVPTESQSLWGKTYDWMFEFSHNWKQATLAEGQPGWHHGVEWCRDWYSAEVPAGVLRDYTGPATGSARVGRSAGERKPLPLTGSAAYTVLRIALVNE